MRNLILILQAAISFNPVLRYEASAESEGLCVRVTRCFHKHDWLADVLRRVLRAQGPLQCHPFHPDRASLAGLEVCFESPHKGRVGWWGQR